MKKKLQEALRTVPDFPKPGIQFKDITPVLNQPELFSFITDSFYEEFKNASIDKVVGIESRGFLFAAPLVHKLGVGMAIVRKPGKLPADKIQVEYQLEYGTDRLEMHKDAILPGERVLIVDDLLATGGTAEAAATLVKQLGGEVVSHVFVIELAFLKARERLQPSPVFSLLQF